MPNYPVPYQNNWGYNTMPSYTAQSMAQGQQLPQTTQIDPGVKWVDGEVGAKAFQMPAGWPPNKPIDLWDTNDTVIYLKSINPMGMPNPLQKAHYTLEEHKSVNPMQSGATEPDMSEYVRKDDMERMKQELMETINGLSISGANRRSTREE